MPNNSFIKKLLERRIPQIIGSYIIAGTSLVLFIDWLATRYTFPQYYTTLALFGIISIIPSVIILAYFHGAPGKDQWTKIEKIGIPANILFIAAMLFIGFKYDYWKIEKEAQNTKSIKYFIHIASLYEDIDIFEDQPILRKLIRGRKLDTLKSALLGSLRKKLKVQLLSEYIDSNKEFTIPFSDKDIEYLKDYSITINNFADTSIIAADSIYKRFNHPDKIFTINLFKFKENSSGNKKATYFYNFINLHCMPYSNSCWSDNIGVDSVNIENELLRTLRNIISKRKTVGVISNIKEDIVSVKLSNLNVKEDMILHAFTVYDFASNGFEIGTLDLQNAIRYYGNLDDQNADLIIEGLKVKLSWLQENSEKPFKALQSRTLTTDPFFYKLRVVEVIDSTAITKVKSKKPYVKIREGDSVVIW